VICGFSAFRIGVAAAVAIPLGIGGAFFWFMLFVELFGPAPPEYYP
jgi:hypothetical protein